MLSDQLGHIIHEQLCINQLVVLPSFGGFVMETVPAELDELRNRIKPPQKAVFFNAKLSHNDGLLIAAIAQKEEVSYSEADDWLTDGISELRFRIENGEIVNWESLGTLQKNYTGQIEFNFDGDSALQDEVYGLKPLSLEVARKDNVDKVRKLVAADGPVATSVRTLPLKKVARYAAAAIAIGFLVWMPFQKGIVGNGDMLVHQLNPFPANVEAVYTPRSFNENWINKGFEKQDLLANRHAQSHLSLYLTENSSKPIVVKTDAVPPEVVAETLSEEPVLETSEANSFSVVAATFSNRSDAADYVAKMIKRGFNAEYAGKDDQGHLVAYGSYNSLEDAQKMLASVSLSNKEARIVSGS